MNKLNRDNVIIYTGNKGNGMGLYASYSAVVYSGLAKKHVISNIQVKAK